jgi:hypothetical protein
MREGKNSIVLTPRPAKRRGQSGCLSYSPVARLQFPRRSGIICHSSELSYQLGNDLCAHVFVGEYFQQDGVGDSAIHE